MHNNHNKEKLIPSAETLFCTSCTRFFSFSLLVIFALFTQNSGLAAVDGASGNTRNYSMTISGGASLGIYEAGANWAIIEALRATKKSKLISVTGSSAGSINTLLTALRYCEADFADNSTTAINNNFYHTWNIQLSHLLPSSADEYNTLELSTNGANSVSIEDSIFSRGKYFDIISDIFNLVRRGKFKGDCSIDVAIVVTRSVPEYLSFGTGNSNTQVPQQRFVVPISLVVEGNSGIVDGITFENNRRYAQLADKSAEYIFLPENAGKVSFDVIARAVMASSAFPIAFGPVELEYCRPATSDSEKKASSLCPANHHLEKDYFLDGGLFDNVPVGVAVDLANAAGNISASKPINNTHNFIFLNPDSDTSGPEKDQPAKPGSIFSFASQTSILPPILTTLRTQVLTNTLSEYFDKQDTRKLLLAQRSLPIAGTYLYAFGAFFDKGFFFHDYAAGVFDGINTIVEHFCNPESIENTLREDCPDGKAALTAHLNSKLIMEPLGNNNDTDAVCDLDECEREIFEKLYSLFASRSATPIEQKGNSLCPIPDSYFRNDAKGYVNQTLAAYTALCKATGTRFDDLVFAMDKTRTLNSSLLKRKKWSYGDDIEFIVGKRASPWAFGILEKSVQRLLDLEKKYDGGSKNSFAATWAMIPGSKNSNTGVLSKSNLLAHLTPDYIGIDGFQSGLYLSWDWTIPTPELNCTGVSSLRLLNHYCQNYSIEAGFSGHLRRVLNERERFNTASVFLGLNFSRPENLLRTSSGIRFLRNADYIPFLDESSEFDTYSSVEFYSRFLGNKIELSLGFQGSSFRLGQDDLTLRIGIYDVDRFLALLF